MYGRYGFDQLGAFLMGAGFLFGILCFFLRFLPTFIPYYVCSFLNTFFYIFAFFRIFSRNTYKRTLENEKFLRLRARIMPLFEDKIKSAKDRNYIYKKCPKCSSKLRLRRIKGKHITKCPKCGHNAVLNSQDQILIGANGARTDSMNSNKQTIIFVSNNLLAKVFA